MTKEKRPFRKPGDLKKKPSVKVDMPGHALSDDGSQSTTDIHSLMGSDDGRTGISNEPLNQVDVPGHRDYVDVPGHRDYLDTPEAPDLPTLDPTKSKLEDQIDKDGLSDK